MLQHPRVSFASVFAKKSHFVGSLVGSKVVVKPVLANDGEKKEFIGELRQLCQKQLQDYMVPAIIQVVDELPLNSTGKVVRA